MDAVATFYARENGLLTTIRTALESAGLDVTRLRPKDLAPIDEFHIRGRSATLEIIDALRLTGESTVLDLGSGLGGPARTIAESTHAVVIGVDLTPEFCEVAAALSEWTGMADRTSFHVADALHTGLPDSSVDGAVTIHVAMNIADKPGLYAEAARVLRPGGRFVVYDVAQGEGGEVHYPVPWASDSSTSFLATPDEMYRMLTKAGFDVIDVVDSSPESLEWFAQMRERVDRDDPAPFTFAAFLGDDFPMMAANQVRNLAEHRIRTVMITCEPPV